MISLGLAASFLSALPRILKSSVLLVQMQMRRSGSLGVLRQVPTWHHSWSGSHRGKCLSTRSTVHVVWDFIWHRNKHWRCCMWTCIRLETLAMLHHWCLLWTLLNSSYSPIALNPLCPNTTLNPFAFCIWQCHTLQCCFKKRNELHYLGHLSMIHNLCRIYPWFCAGFRSISSD